MSRQAQLGVFAIVALALLFGIFYIITDFGTRHSGYRMGVHFASSAGLPTGAQVFFSGVTVGTVDRVELLPDNTVEVILAIQNGINIPRGSKFTVQAPITGTPNLVITPPSTGPLVQGTVATPVPLADTIPTHILPLDQQPVGTPVRTIGDFMAEGQKEIARLDTMLALLQSREPKLLDTLQATLATVNATTADLHDQLSQTFGGINELTGTLNETAKRNQYRVDALLASFDATAVSLNQSMDALQSLATDPRLKNNLIATTSNIRDLTANVAGLTADLHTITGDPQTQAQLRDTTANLDATMQKANSLLGSLGGRSHVYGIDAGATPYPSLPPGALPPPGTQTPPPHASLTGGLRRMAGHLVQVQARFSELSPQRVIGPNPLLSSDRGPQADLNAIFLPDRPIGVMAGVNDVGGNSTWNLLGLKRSGGLRLGGGVLYSQIGALASYQHGAVGAQTRVYDLRRPTFDLYGNINLSPSAQLFLGERDSTRSDRRTVYGLQLKF